MFGEGDSFFIFEQPAAKGNSRSV